MGKGDRKTKRGKLFQGSYGVRRRKNATSKMAIAAKPKEEKETIKVPKEVKEIKEAKEIKEVKPVKEIKEPKVAKEVAHPKTAKAATTAKKEPRPKKTENA